MTKSNSVTSTKKAEPKITAPAKPAMIKSKSTKSVQSRTSAKSNGSSKSKPKSKEEKPLKIVN